jgi:hypothetical protein
LAERLRAVADPALVVYPRIEAHAWYEDWDALQPFLQEGVELVIPATDLRENPEAFQWLKAQLFFAIRSGSVAEIIREQVDLRLFNFVRDKRVAEIIAAVNRYMSYGTQPAAKQVLKMWTDLRVERREERARGQVSLGDIDTSELDIRRSLAVVNHPDPNLHVFGARSFLVHVVSGASFELSHVTLNLLSGGRSFRTSDRPHTDMEWHLSKFFSRIASSRENASRLEVMDLDFEAMASHVRSYRLSIPMGSIEPTGEVA